MGRDALEGDGLDGLLAVNEERVDSDSVAEAGDRAHVLRARPDANLGCHCSRGHRHPQGGRGGPRRRPAAPPAPGHGRPPRPARPDRGARAGRRTPAERATSPRRSTEGRSRPPRAARARLLRGPLPHDPRPIFNRLLGYYAGNTTEAALLAEAETLPKALLGDIEINWLQVIGEGWAAPLKGFLREGPLMQVSN